MKTVSADFLICGGGIIGLTIARELVKYNYDNIIVIEKEDDLGKHASGRNSGVLHAGIYYSSDSLKAKSCLSGNFLMRQYCKEKSLPILETGKVIVAKDDNDIRTLKELCYRAEKNGAKVELIDEKQLEEIEPNAKTCETALYSYHTAVVDPKKILESLYDDIISSGKVNIFFKTRFVGIIGSNTVLTNNVKIRFGTFINAAGSNSDRIAHAFGVGLNYKLIPFKGIYKKLKKEKSNIIRGCIYPTPDIRNPFLGVHFTKDMNDEVYLGPTAIPAFGRENYGILKGMDSEAFNIFIRDTILICSNPGFREVVFSEPKKYFFKYFCEDAEKLVKGLHPEDIVPSGKVGIRPQLVDWDKKELVMDFLIIKDGNCIHLLNTISPGFTSSMYFAEFLVKEYIRR